mgnify:CR=1 FL=1
MLRTQVYLTEELYQEINLLAQKERKASAQVLRELLIEGLSQKKKRTSIGNALLTLSKIKAHGPKDLSTNIDEYLYSK